VARLSVDQRAKIKIAIRPETNGRSPLPLRPRVIIFYLKYQTGLSNCDYPLLIENFEILQAIHLGALGFLYQAMGFLITTGTHHQASGLDSSLKFFSPARIRISPWEEFTEGSVQVSSLVVCCPILRHVRGILG
jgi:hypothetical protein